MSDPFKGRIIDLSHPLDNLTPPYPGDPAPEKTDLATVKLEGYALSQWSVNFHSGTHVDAPAHFVEHGDTIRDLNPERWIGPAMVIPTMGAEVIGPEILPPDDTWRDCKFLLFHTGWDSHYGEQTYFEGHPVLSESLAEMIAGSNLTAIGVDTPSPDRAPYPVHTLLLRKGICILENLRGLDQLPALRVFTLVCIPLPIDAEASWVRPLAILPEEGRRI